MSGFPGKSRTFVLKRPLPRSALRNTRSARVEEAVFLSFDREARFDAERNPTNEGAIPDIDFAFCSGRLSFRMAYRNL